MPEEEALVSGEEKLLAGIGALAFPCAAALAVPCLQALTGGLPLQYLLKDVHGLGPAASSRASAPCALVWAARPLWGFVSDAVPLLGLRRKSYAALASAAAALALLYLGHRARSLAEVVTALCVANLGMVFLVVVAQAVLAEQAARSASPSSAAGRVAAFLVLRQLGLLSGTLVSGRAVHEGAHPHLVFARASAVPLALLCLALCLPERRRPVASPDLRQLGEGVASLAAFLGRPGFRNPAAFIALYAATPKVVHAMFFFYTDVVRFSPGAVMGVSMIPHILSIAGMLAYLQFLREGPPRPILAAMSVVVACLSTLSLLLLFRVNVEWGVGDAFLLPFDDGLATAALEVALLPVMAHCVRDCPERMEGAACASLMAAYHLGLFCSAHLSGALTSGLLGITRGDLSLLWVAKIVTSALQLLPLLLLGLLPESFKSREAEASRPC